MYWYELHYTLGLITIQHQAVVLINRQNMGYCKVYALHEFNSIYRTPVKLIYLNTTLLL